MATRFRFLVLCLFTACLLVTGGAFGEDPTAADKETARGLMDRGDELTEKGDRKGALEAYRGAWSMVRVPTTGTAVARTLHALGRFAEAKRVADEVVALPAKPDEPDALVAARAEAKKISSDAAPRIATLTVTLKGVPAGGAPTLTLDGESVPGDELGKGVQVDAGDHVVVARIDDWKGEARASLGAGEKKAVTLTLSREKKAAATPKAAPGGNSKRTLGFVIGGVGVVGLATAGITGAMLLSRDQQIKDNCPNKECNREGRDLIDGNKPLFAVNAVAWGVGVVGLGVGAYLVLTSKSGSEPVPNQTAIGSTLVPGGAGLTLGRSF